jgi:phosphoribosylglycinamide formyltransferase-1
MGKPVRLGVFLSGGGTTLQNLIDRIADGRLGGRIEFVLSSRADAYGLQRAKAAGIPTLIVSSKAYRRNWDAFSEAVEAAIAPYEVDLICLAGFMCFYRVPPQRAGRVMNTHPALIPAFCGQAMYGHHVYEALLERGVRFTGCTIHFVDNEYDSGPIILQKVVPVLPDDDAESLSARVQAAEREAFPEAIRLFGEGRLRVEGRRVRILPPTH